MFETEADIGKHGAPRQQPRVLEHERYRQPESFCARVHPGFPGAWREQPGDDAQQGGFADPGRAQHGDEATRRDVEVEVAEHFGPFAVAGKCQADAAQRNYRFHRSTHDCSTTKDVSIRP